MKAFDKLFFFFFVAKTVILRTKDDSGKEANVFGGDNISHSE